MTQGPSRTIRSVADSPSPSTISRSPSKASSPGPRQTTGAPSSTRSTASIAHVLVETRRDRGAQELAGALAPGPGPRLHADAEIVLGLAGHQQTADRREPDARRLGARQQDARELAGIDLQQAARMVVDEQSRVDQARGSRARRRSGSARSSPARRRLPARDALRRRGPPRRRRRSPRSGTERRCWSRSRAAAARRRARRARSCGSCRRPRAPRSRRSRPRASRGPRCSLSRAWPVVGSSRSSISIGRSRASVAAEAIRNESRERSTRRHPAAAAPTTMRVT